MLAFIHIEKAAGTVVNSCLRLIFGHNHVDVEPWDNRSDYFSKDDLRRLKIITPGVRSIAGHKIKPYGDLETYEEPINYYTFLRDPITRCASHYQYHINIMGLNIPFVDWINDKNYQNFQVKKISGNNDITKAKEIISSKIFFVGILEEFDQSARRFYKRIGIDLGVAKNYKVRENIATDNNIKNMLLADPESKERLIKANQLDIELYSFAKKFNSMKQTEDNQRVIEKPSRMKLYLNILYRNTYYKPILMLYRKFCTTKM